MFSFKIFQMGKTLLGIFYKLMYVTTATLPEVTSAISHSDRGSCSRREEMCHFGNNSRSAEVAYFFPKGVTSAIRLQYRGRSFLSSRSHLIVPSAIENACRGDAKKKHNALEVEASKFLYGVSCVVHFFV